MRILIAAGALALALAGAASAQSTRLHSGLRLGLLDRNTAGDPSAALPTSDYVLRARQSDAFEVQEGQMASSMAAAPAVRAFGVAMVQAHRRLAAALARTLEGEGESAAAPPPLTADQQAQIDQLRDLHGAAFDRAYIDQQLSAHDEALTVETAYARGGSDPDLRRAAAAAIPTVRDHLLRLRTLQARTVRG